MTSGSILLLTCQHGNNSFVPHPTVDPATSSPLPPPAGSRGSGAGLRGPSDSLDTRALRRASAQGFVGRADADAPLTRINTSSALLPTRTGGPQVP